MSLQQLFPENLNDKTGLDICSKNSEKWLFQKLKLSPVRAAVVC